MMRIQLSSETSSLHLIFIFGVYWDNLFLQNWYTGFEHQAIVCFMKQSEVDIVHTETACFVLSWVSQLL